MVDPRLWTPSYLRMFGNVGNCWSFIELLCVVVFHCCCVVVNTPPVWIVFWPRRRWWSRWSRRFRRSGRGCPSRGQRCNSGHSLRIARLRRQPEKKLGLDFFNIAMELIRTCLGQHENGKRQIQNAKSNTLPKNLSNLFFWWNLSFVRDCITCNNYKSIKVWSQCFIFNCKTTKKPNFSRFVWLHDALNTYCSATRVLIWTYNRTLLDH